LSYNLYPTYDEWGEGYLAQLSYGARLSVRWRQDNEPKHADS
jgi:hypothetical protein